MTNLSIAQEAVLRPIDAVARDAGLHPEDYEPWGRYKGKLTAEGIARLTSQSKNGKLVLVTAMNPGMQGEGKTTVTIGLSQGLTKIGKSAISATREPALGPIFGRKGGACGGGYSQVLPMEDINLFFNGDFPAIAAAHNLLSAVLDAHIHNGNRLNIDTRVDLWPRTVDMNDRALRQIATGLGGKNNGPVKETGFVITPASEVMAILCLSRSLAELKGRLGDIVVAVTADNRPVTARDLQAAGAMTALLKDAIRPNLVQTIEGGLAIVHGGPFGNIAHGCSTIVGTECSLGLADFTVTEAGFGSDLGGEKFLNIVCPRLGRGPDAIVVVATVRTTKYHGGGELTEGVKNLFRHVAHLSQYGPQIVVAINRFAEDTEEEHKAFRALCEQHGIAAISCEPFTLGGAGCQELAARVAELAAQPSSFEPLYRAEDPLEQKLHRLVTKVYGGNGATLTPSARKDLEWIRKNGYEALPVCVAKTQYSFSDDASLLNAPSGFTVTVRGLRLSAGAGFIVALCGDIMLMPGLGRTPALQNIDISEDGKITGLF